MKSRKSKSKTDKKPLEFDGSNAVLICVGVEDYSHMPSFPGACESANQVFNMLTESVTSIVNAERSRLLLNPSYDEFHRFLESHTYFLKPEDHLYVYFCGRTELVNNTCVLCFRDSVLLPSGLINPFTVQGWQSFFQLAGVGQIRSAVFLWDALGRNANQAKVSTRFMHASSN